MRLQPPDENGMVYLLCQHCGVGNILTSKPIPDVILPTLVCPECRKDTTGQVIPALEMDGSPYVPPEPSTTPEPDPDKSITEQMPEDPPPAPIE